MVSRWFKEHAETPLPDDPSEVLALGYLRVSGRKQAQRGVSLDAQEREITDFVAGKGWEQGHIYKDVAKGTKTNRADWLKLREAIRTERKQGRAVVVVARAIDRTGRDDADLAEFRKEVKKLTGETPFYTDEKGQVDDLHADFQGLRAKLEVRTLAQRVRGSKTELARKGLPPSGRPLWGYRWRLPRDEAEAAKMGTKGGDVRRVLDEDPDQKPYVQELFERVDRGESIYKVCAWVAGLDESVRGPRKFWRQNLLRLLQNPVYVGRYTREPISDPDAILALDRGLWPALIADDVWLRVQQRLAGQTWKGTRGRPAHAGFLLTGIVRCDKCGSKMYAEPRPDRATIYRCAGRLFGVGHAEHQCASGLRLVALDNVVLAELAFRLAWLTRDAPGLEGHYAQVWATMQPRPLDPETEDRRGHLQRAVNRAREQVAALEKLDGVLDAETLDASRGKLLADLADARSALNALPPPAKATALPPLPELRVSGREWYRRLMGADLAERVGVMRALVERVVPVRLGKGHGTPPVEAARIVWSPIGWAIYRLTTVVIPAELEDEWHGDTCPVAGTPSLFRGDAQGKLTRQPHVEPADPMDVAISGYRHEQGLDADVLATLAGVMAPVVGGAR